MCLSVSALFTSVSFSIAGLLFLLLILITFLIKKKNWNISLIVFLLLLLSSIFVIALEIAVPFFIVSAGKDATSGIAITIAKLYMFFMLIFWELDILYSYVMVNKSSGKVFTKKSGIIAIIVGVLLVGWNIYACLTQDVVFTGGYGSAAYVVDGPLMSTVE